MNEHAKKFFSSLQDSKSSSLSAFANFLKENNRHIRYLNHLLKFPAGRERIKCLNQRLEEKGVFSSTEFYQNRREFLGNAWKTTTGLAFLSSPLVTACATALNTSNWINVTGILMHPIWGPQIYHDRGSAEHFESFSARPAIDFDVGVNFPAVATAEGVVKMTAAEWGGFYLNHVEDQSAYLHLESFSAKKGDKLRRGQIVGLTGDKTSGKRRAYSSVKTQPHLHWEVRRKKSPYKFGADFPERAGFGNGKLVLWDGEAIMDYGIDANKDKVLKLKMERLDKDFLTGQLDRTVNTPIPKRYIWIKSPKDFGPIYESLKTKIEKPYDLAKELRSLIMDKEMFSYGHPVYKLFLEVNAATDTRLASLTHPCSPSKPLL